jgi:hypothetical protein
MNSIKRNMQAMPSGKSEVSGEKVRNVNVSASFSFRQEIKESTPEGGIFIRAGGSASLDVSFSGSISEVAEESTRKINTITITSDDIILQKDGADVAKLQTIDINYGGSVSVRRFEALGKLQTAQGVESLGRLMLLLLALSGGRPEDRLALAEARPPSLEPEIVSGIAIRQINAALTRAIKQFLQIHHNVVPGVDLYDVFGITPPAGDFPVTPPARRTSAPG